MNERSDAAGQTPRAAAMQFFVHGWKFGFRRTCLVRCERVS